MRERTAHSNARLTIHDERGEPLHWKPILPTIPSAPPDGFTSEKMRISHLLLWMLTGIALAIAVGLIAAALAMP